MRRALRIKDLPLFTRPREKLFAKGPANLSDEELIAILLGSGTKKQNALRLAKILLGAEGIAALAKRNEDGLTGIRGVGKTKAARIVAAVEIGRRIFSGRSVTKRIIRTCADALEQLRDIAGAHQEHLVVLYLNARHELIQKQTVTVGSLNTTYAEPRSIFAPALTLPCASVIMAHNHPSDDCTPSKGDLLFTTRIYEAGLLLGIDLVDHMILCPSGYFSFREHGLIEKKG